MCFADAVSFSLCCHGLNGNFLFQEVQKKVFVVYRSPHYACPEVIRVSFVLLICAELKIIILAIFGQPFVKLFALCYQTILCPICLSVTLVYCGQTVGWIKMKLGVQVGLGLATMS